MPFAGAFSTASPNSRRQSPTISPNAEPKPFLWTKSADVILAKVDRARATLAEAKPGTNR
jgi:hypothetical protein